MKVLIVEMTSFGEMLTNEQGNKAGEVICALMKDYDNLTLDFTACGPISKFWLAALIAVISEKYTQEDVVNRVSLKGISDLMRQVWGTYFAYAEILHHAVETRQRLTFGSTKPHLN